MYNSTLDNFFLTSKYSPIISIPCIDLLLCLLYTNKARWFQLHSVINMIIVLIIKDDVIALIYDPFNNIDLIDNPLELYYILYLHLYHFLFFKNSLMDYFHHILFVLFGCLPIYYLYNLNILRLCVFVGCGLPGMIEYLTLSLVKHKIISNLFQKNLVSYIYNYFRYPFSIYSITTIYFVNIYEYPLEFYTVLYTILICYLNGAFFNKLTIENYMYHKYIIKL